MVPKPITLVTFGSVRPAHQGAEASAWALARYLHEQGRLDRVVCFEFDDRSSEIPADKFVVPYPLLYRIGMRALSILEGRVVRDTRRLREMAFDLLASRTKAVAEAQAVLFIKPNFRLTAQALARRRAPTFAIASILHPRLNRDRVAAEAERLGIVDRSSYVDPARVDRLSAFFETCDHVIVLSDVAMRSYIEYGIDPQRLILLGVTKGADCERFAPAPVAEASPGLRVLHLSSMNLIKGVGLLFEAWRRLDLDDAELILGGSMDESAASVFDTIAPPNVRLLGPVLDSPKCYLEADVFVSSSLSDNGPFTILEALASGLPVIASDACGASELIREGENGFVYAYDDLEGLERALAWVSVHRERLPEMGRAARQTALDNRRDRFAESVLERVDEAFG